MPNWFYYNNNERIAATSIELRTLAKEGVITPATIIETDTGKRATADKVKGLVFGLPQTPDIDVVWDQIIQSEIETNSDQAIPTQQIESPFLDDPYYNDTKKIKYELQGIGATLEVHENKIIIKRAGVGAFILHGIKGDKTLYYHQLSAIQFKVGGTVVSGYIQFSLLGGTESKGGIFGATQDENTVLFSSSENEYAKKIHDYIEQKILESHEQKTNLQPISQPMPQPQTSVVDEIRKMKELLDIGAVTQDEFDSFKQKLLS